MSTDLKLTLDKDGVSVDSSKYRCMIGCLLYLTDYRPDIMFSVSSCARFQNNPKESHMDAILRIFKYIRSTQYLGIWYPNGSVGECLTQWCCKKQIALDISTIEAEYVVARRACQQALWMRQAIKDYDTDCEDVLVLCDNKDRKQRLLTRLFEIAKSEHPKPKQFQNCKSVDPIFSTFNMSNFNIAIEHGASSSQAHQMNPEEQIESEINSWFDETTWNQAETEISPDEVLEKE
ncbi:hypothetical protein Tco_0767464 [Tanacetum coccineum]